MSLSLYFSPNINQKSYDAHFLCHMMQIFYLFLSFFQHGCIKTQAKNNLYINRCPIFHLTNKFIINQQIILGKVISKRYNQHAHLSFSMENLQQSEFLDIIYIYFSGYNVHELEQKHKFIHGIVNGSMIPVRFE